MRPELLSEDLSDPVPGWPEGSGAVGQARGKRREVKVPYVGVARR